MTKGKNLGSIEKRKYAGELENRLRGRCVFDPKPDMDNASVGSKKIVNRSNTLCFP